MASEYKNMADFIADDEGLLDILAANHCKVTGKAIKAGYSGSAFQVLADMTSRGYRLYNPALLARAWGISRQSVNNSINRGLLVTIEFNGGFSAEYKYIVFESIEAQGQRKAGNLPRTLEIPAIQELAEEPVRDAAGLIQGDLPLYAPIGFEGLGLKELADRDSICKEWFTCDFRGTCFNQEINVDCLCQKDEEANLLPAPPLAMIPSPALEELRKKSRSITDARGEKLQGVVEALEVKAETTPATRAELYQEHPAEIPTVEELKAARFGRDEIKILRSGFSLVKYDREKKTIHRTCQDPRLGWYLSSIAPSYAEAERRLAELLKDPASVQVSIDGKGVYTGRDENKLTKVGFEFYRAEGGHFADDFARIKSRSTGWGTFKRFDKGDRPSMLAAFAELLKNDEKALEG